jgi:hypothetical protein
LSCRSSRSARAGSSDFANDRDEQILISDSGEHRHQRAFGSYSLLIPRKNVSRDFDGKETDALASQIPDVDREGLVTRSSGGEGSHSLTVVKMCYVEDHNLVGLALGKLSKDHHQRFTKAFDSVTKNADPTDDPRAHLINKTKVVAAHALAKLDIQQREKVILTLEQHIGVLSNDMSSKGYFPQEVRAARRSSEHGEAYNAYCTKQRDDFSHIEALIEALITLATTLGGAKFQEIGSSQEGTSQAISPDQPLE